MILSGTPGVPGEVNFQHSPPLCRIILTIFRSISDSRIFTPHFNRGCRVAEVAEVSYIYTRIGALGTYFMSISLFFLIPVIYRQLRQLLRSILYVSRLSAVADNGNFTATTATFYCILVADGCRKI